jgi:alpha-glucuronidase
VVQAIYDSHYEGAEAAENYVQQWKSLAGRVDDERYGAVLAQLEYQAGQAQVWRDAVNNWFFRESGIADAKERVGHYPGRVEAESMQLQGYAVVAVTPWEAASGGKAVICSGAASGAAPCAATFRYEGAPGWYTLRVQYFDQNNGVAHFRLRVQNQLVDEWAAADHLPTQKIDGSSSTRRTVAGIALRPGDEIHIEGMPEGGDTAAVDYIEVQPDTN